ncbi:hypothetical protein AVEN_208553-1 [Araneus ventricosus]|uniref:Uncharacterized protein n=1 Tax=Araneus ventricosus TaxID=182803 RepID=A0A4Y2R709_ARAVE|nr:hypothetical protein AVEN_208553-1 [Araneus ventricosus]
MENEGLFTDMKKHAAQGTGNNSSAQDCQCAQTKNLTAPVVAKHPRTLPSLTIGRETPKHGRLVVYREHDYPVEQKGRRKPIPEVGSKTHGVEKEKRVPKLSRTHQLSEH